MKSLVFRTAIVIVSLLSITILNAQTDSNDIAKPNTLTQKEKDTGWKLLFDGNDLSGPQGLPGRWHSFKRDDVQPGWQVKEGMLVCADPHNAGDLCTNDKYDWFELQLEYNITEAGNSGIIYHVTDEGDATWQTGPEFQLEDNEKAADKIRCGWLYGLYQPSIDPNTGQNPRCHKTSRAMEPDHFADNSWKM